MYRLKKYILLFNLNIVAFSCGQEWTSIGPYGGWFTTIKASKSNPNVLYVGTYYGGVYKSTDNGENWQYIGFRGNTIIINSIAIDPIDDQNIYISYYDDSTNTNTTCKSTNGGKNWLNLFIQSEILVTSSKEKDVGFLYNDNGLYKTTNGVLFIKINYDFEFNHIWTVTPDPVNPDVVYVGTGITIFKSTDKGETWVKLKDVRDSVNLWASVNCFAVSNKDNQKIVIGTSMRGVLYSKDGGKTWIENATFTKSVNNIFIDERNDDIIYLMEQWRLSKSTDFCNTFSVLSTKYRIKEACIQKDKIFLLDQQTGTIIKSDDQGVNWLEINNGISNVFIQSMLAIDNKLLSIVWKGNNQTLFLSYDNNQWDKMNNNRPYSGHAIIQNQ